MLNYIDYKVTDFEFCLSDDMTTIRGTCNVQATVGVPIEQKNYDEVRVKINVLLSDDKTERNIIKLEVIFDFSAEDIKSEDDLISLAQEKGIPIALNKTKELVATLTKTLIGRSFELPIIED